MAATTIQGDFNIKREQSRSYSPPLTRSTNWKHWLSIEDHRRCEVCKNMHGKIYPIQVPLSRPPEHMKCRCDIFALSAVKAGEVTIEKKNGADWWIVNYKMLPLYYITTEDLQKYGWIIGEKPSKYVQGKMLTRGIYTNRNKHLPSASGRIWYEADLNYYGGKRNSHRLLWSNDGLVFVTYDHYKTFIEVK